MATPAAAGPGDSVAGPPLAPPAASVEPLPPPPGEGDNPVLLVGGQPLNDDSRTNQNGVELAGGVGPSDPPAPPTEPPDVCHSVDTVAANCKICHLGVGRCRKIGTEGEMKIEHLPAVESCSSSPPPTPCRRPPPPPPPTALLTRFPRVCASAPAGHLAEGTAPEPQNGRASRANSRGLWGGDPIDPIEPEAAGPRVALKRKFDDGSAADPAAAAAAEGGATEEDSTSNVRRYTAAASTANPALRGKVCTHCGIKNGNAAKGA